MEAYAYKLIIYTSTLEWTHNMGQRIWEIYIPIIGAVFNEAGGMFLHKGPRDPNAELIPVELPLEVVTGVEHLIKRQTKMDEMRKQIFNELKAKHSEAQEDPLKEKIDAWVEGGRKGDLDLTTPPDTA